MNTIDIEYHVLRMLISKTILQIYFNDMDDKEILEWFEENPNAFQGYDC
jgi:hypothetical protein